MTIQEFATTYRLKTRLDVDGTTIIPGKMGQIYEFDANKLGVMIMPPVFRRSFWGVQRALLAGIGCEITQNGDSEGCALFAPENQQQARVAIRCARIKTKRVISEAQREKLSARMRALHNKE